MSERGGKLLKDEMAVDGSCAPEGRRRCTTRMVATAKDLAARGEIVLSDGKADDELIY
jgi:flagellar motor switch protein FliG